MSDKMSEYKQTSLGVISQKEIDGVEMGVLDDGTAFLTGRGLAKLCNVAPGIILTWAHKWSPVSPNPRDQAVRNSLEEQGYQDEELFRRVTVNGTNVLAFPEQSCMAILEYYAFAAKQTESKEKAQHNYRRLARAGFRLFVYKALGYSREDQIPDKWKKFHDRVTLNRPPIGYFSVFAEMSGIIVTAINRGLQVDEHTVPDISVGIAWGKFWSENGFDESFGKRKKFPHVYPDYFPQGKADVEAWIYPVEALGLFRKWIYSEYLPNKFPKYLKNKSSSGALPASTVELILEEINDDLKSSNALHEGGES